MSIHNILSQDAFWIVNKSISRQFKCNNTSMLLSELIDKESYFKKNKMITDDGYFYATSESIEESINISYHIQKTCIKKLENAGFIETKLKGIPAKLHFKVVENKILKFLNTGIIEFEKLDDENSENYYIERKNKEKEQRERTEEVLQLSPSNSFSNLPDNSNSYSGGTKDIPSPSPSNTPLPPDIKTLGVKMFDLLRSKMRAEMDDILSRTELDLPTLSEMFAEYWVYNKGREFDPKNHKGITSSFQKWFDVGGSKELPQKEISNGIKGKTIMEEIIDIVRKKKGIEMTSDEATAVKKFLAETILTDEQLKMEVTRRFLMGGGTTWKTWLTIAGNVQDEEIYHRRLNGKVVA